MCERASSGRDLQRRSVYRHFTKSGVQLARRSRIEIALNRKPVERHLLLSEKVRPAPPKGISSHSALDQNQFPIKGEVV